MKKEEFEALVKGAILDLPSPFRKKMENIAIVIEANPTEEQLKKTGIKFGNVLLGLYEGVPEITWGKKISSHLPDKITIFQDSIENLAPSEEEIKKLIKKVVRHEIAHYVGFGEKGVKELENNKL